MSQPESRSIILAALGAMILTPLLGLLLSQLLRPKKASVPKWSGKNRLRNQIIEYASCMFFLIGAYVPFFFHGTNRIKPTIENLTLLFSCGALFMFGGTAALALIMGDRGAASFLAYFQHERGISSTGLLVLVKIVSVTAILAIAIIAFKFFIYWL